MRENRKYETLVVFASNMNDTQIQEGQKKIEALLTAEGAKSVAHQSWGKRQLAYPMKKQSAGTYVCFTYESEASDTVKNVSSVLRITDGILKFQNHVIKERVRKFRGNTKRPAGASMFDEGDGIDY